MANEDLKKEVSRHFAGAEREFDRMREEMRKMEAMLGEMFDKAPSEPGSKKQDSVIVRMSSSPQVIEVQTTVHVHLNAPDGLGTLAAQRKACEMHARFAVSRGYISPWELWGVAMRAWLSRKPKGGV